MEEKNRTIRENREYIKKSVDKNSMFIYVDKDNVVTTGRGIDLIKHYGMLTMAMIEEYDEKIIRDTFKMALDASRIKEEDLEEELKDVKKDILNKLNKLKEMLERE